MVNISASVLIKRFVSKLLRVVEVHFNYYILVIERGGYAHEKTSR